MYSSFPYRQQPLRCDCEQLVEQQEENEKAEKKAREEHQHDSKNDTQVKAAKAD